MEQFFTSGWQGHKNKLLKMFRDNNERHWFINFYKQTILSSMACSISNIKSIMSFVVEGFASDKKNESPL